MPRSDQEVLYPHYEVRLFCADPEEMKHWTRDKKAKGLPLTPEVAKEILGWEEEKDGKYKDDYLLIDYNGNKIRCLYNLANRPFYAHVAEAWKLEILRGKWKLNGETTIVDKYGNVHDGQHRLLGLILAYQAWLADCKLSKDEQVWSQFWPVSGDGPFIETFLVLGIAGDDDTVNTIGTGKPRTFTDVMFRSEYFDGLKNTTKKLLAKSADWAIKLVWDRTAQKQVSYCPKRSHSESMDFISRHERILKAVRYIYSLTKGPEDKLKDLITPGMASGLLYLMGTANSDFEEYEQSKSEEGLSFKTWEKAELFWKDLINNGKATEVVREQLLKIPPHVQGQFGRDLRVGTVIKAWNLYLDRKPIKADLIEMETSVNDIGIEVIVEKPIIGGIDLEFEKPEKKAKEKEVAAPKKESAGECIKGGSHEWDTDDVGTFCVKCKEPKLVKRKRK